MALIEADPPSEPLFHIGRNPDPLAWTEWQYVGEGRFDDPRWIRRFRVLYAAEQRLAAFVETLQKWRPSIEALAALNRVGLASGVVDATEEAAGLIPADWHLKRGLSTLRLLPEQRWLDVRVHDTRETLRNRLAHTLEALGYDDFDLSDTIGRDRRLTQAIALYAYLDGFQGIAYKSRFDDTFNCWAIFEGARFEQVGRLAIMRSDPDLLEVARRFNLHQG